MSDALWLTTAAALTLLSMGWLALAMEMHWGQVMHHRAEAAVRIRWVLRGLGILAMPLSLSLLACLMVDHPSMAVLVWVMLLASSAVAIALTLAYWPQVLRTLCPVRALL